MQPGQCGQPIHAGQADVEDDGVGAAAAASVSACSAEAATATECPSRVSARCNAQQTASSSSMRRMCFMFVN